MAAFNKFLQFVEELAKKAHNLDTDTLRLALTNTAPTNTDTVFTPGSLHPPPAATNGYTSGGNTVAGQDAEQTAGTLTLSGNDSVFTASGGNLGPFRYVILWNDTHASDGLIGWWDYGSSITLADGETFTVDFGSSILTLA
jgi:hypothetical protein